MVIEVLYSLLSLFLLTSLFYMYMYMYQSFDKLISNEVHRKTDTLFPGNNTTAAELEPPTIRSGGSSSNH